MGTNIKEIKNNYQFKVKVMKRFLGIEQKRQIRETNVWLKNKGVQLSTDMRKSISVEICKPNIYKNTKKH